MNTHILLGTNLGDREALLEQARVEISALIGRISRQSSIYETQSWGYNDADYLNQVIICETELAPLPLLDTIHGIEARMGRVRSGQGYQARPIDIDILLYGSLCMQSEVLTIPHRLMQERRFVLEPLAEIDGNLIHPRLAASIGRLLKDCRDNSNVKLYKKIF